MPTFRILLLSCIFLFNACSALPAAHETIPPTITASPAAPADVSDPQNCGYQWAYQDLPELSSSFQQSIQGLQPEAQANAFAYGENCILSDGSIAGFSAMETDFNVTLPVSDLTNEAELGDWIVKVMQVISAIPPDQIVGPQRGRVSLVFTAGDQQTAINFYVNQYQSLPPGLSSGELFQALQTPP